MNERLAAADAALKAGRRDEAIDHLIAVCTDDPAQPLQIYRVLALQLYGAGRYAEGDTWTGKAVERFPREVELWNIRGVILRKLSRQPEALVALETAAKLSPNNLPVMVNRGNVLLDLRENVRAEQVFTKLARLDPRSSDHQRQLGRALLNQGKRDAAAMRFRQAVTLKKDNIDAWLDMVTMEHLLNRESAAEVVIDKALAANPDNPKLLEGKAVVIRRTGQLRRAEAFLREVAPRFEGQAWWNYQLGVTLSEYDREQANLYLRKAVEIEPGNLDYLTLLIESIERTRTGDEAANIEEAYQLAQKLLARAGGKFSTPQTKVLNEVLIRVCAFDELPQIGDFRSLGRGWAESGRHTALLKQLAFIRGPEERIELLEQHRIWGRDVEAKAKQNPLKRPPPRPADGRIRLGLMSSDLRRHPVAYFALPLFDHIDRSRFDIYCYSFYQGQKDDLQTYIEGQVTAFRWMPDAGFQEAAQVIADDQLDMLIELGGSTHMNKLEVMAYRPAPRQASWLGYPHSAGLEAIDYFICDPYSVPPDRSLLLERPLMMPHTWLALGRAVFSDKLPPTGDLPQDRKGCITFGTANNPHKYSRQVLRAWARVMMATPGSKFAFIRPEGRTPSFRKNVLAEFAAGGVDESRIEFHTVRGAHMPFYNEIDITLDPFPLTGGTTTTESLWMGVPVVSLRGQSFHERLSYSILSNAGVGDLVGGDLEEYQAIALKLVADHDRRADLRKTLRDRIKASPLGQTEAFAKDFYDMVAKAVAEPPVKR